MSESFPPPNYGLDVMLDQSENFPTEEETRARLMSSPLHKILENASSDKS